MSDVGKWGFPVPQTEHFKGNSLEQAIHALNAQTKQAMYAAASKRPIRRGSWNGCAFNAAGEEVQNDSVKSTSTAAEVFGLTPDAVSRFIYAWDATVNTMSEDEATTALLAFLEKDLYSDGSGTSEKHREAAEYVVFKSMEQRIAEFEAQFAADEVPLTDEAVELLLLGV